MDKQSVKNIVKLLSIIGIYLGLFFTIPIGVGWYYDEDIILFLLFDIGFLSFNAFIYMLLRSHFINLSLREGIFSVNIIWILVGFGGGIPLWLYTKVSLMQAVFESISGFTTTGATVYTHIEALPHMILFLRSLMHWIGGMGILVLGVGLLSLINPSGSMALFKAEASGIRLDKPTPKIKDTALRLWFIYIVLTVVDTALLKFGGMSMFDAVNHAFSTVSTGGFSTKDNSFGAFTGNAFILWTTTFFMIVSGITFLAHLHLLRGSFKGYKNEETKWYLIIFLLLSLLMALVKYHMGDSTFFYSLTHASFSVASLMSTTGFASTDYETWGSLEISLAFLAMIASANGGSTAGGVKIIRYVIAFKGIYAELKKILHPNTIIRVFINGNAVSNSLTAAIFAFILLFVMVNGVIIFYLYSSGYDLMTSLSASLACVGNIGPGFALVGPSHNYAFFTDIDLFVLSIGMIIGRLEVLTFLLIFLPSFWKRF